MPGTGLREACRARVADRCDGHPNPRALRFPRAGRWAYTAALRVPILLNKNSSIREGLSVLHHKARGAVPAAISLILLCAATAARADAPQPEIPTCDKKIGS